MTARPMTDGERAYRNVTAEAMLRHVRVVTKDNTVQLWLGATHIVNVEHDSIPAIALQAFAADQPHALSTSAAVRGMREAGQFLLDRLNDLEINDEIARDWMGHVEPAIGRFRHAIEDAALSGIEPGEDEQATRAEDGPTAPTDRLQSKESSQ